jgi:periplasmic copper chaperone A
MAMKRDRPVFEHDLEKNVNRLWLIPTASIALLLSACGQAPELKVNDAVVKLSPVDNNPSALYFTVHGGMQDTELVRVISKSVVRTEMHDTVSDPKTGMLTMTPLQRVKVPAKGKVEFKRGGKHAMLYGVNLVARRLEKLDAEFVFSDGSRIIVTAPLEKIAAGKDEHSGH